MLICSTTLFALISGCGEISPHSGRIPFSWIEKPPAIPKGSNSVTMGIAMEHRSDAGPLSPSERHSLRPGDVIAFHMSHQDTWKQLRKGSVQKLPYELFRYGHIALVVPVAGESELRLLQVAMKQAVNTDEDLNYLTGKSWLVYRPPHGSVDPARLEEFSRQVTENANDTKAAYDYSGALGINNAPYRPDFIDEIGNEFSCATLVVAALHYSGFSLDAVHRNGFFDIVTPQQVVESHAAVSENP